MIVITVGEIKSSIVINISQEVTAFLFQQAESSIVSFVFDNHSENSCLKKGKVITYSEQGKLTESVAAKTGLPARVFSTKAPTQVTPGVTKLAGQHIDDLGRVQPWKASYDNFGRLIERTDWNAANSAFNINAT